MPGGKLATKYYYAVEMLSIEHVEKSIMDQTASVPHFFAIWLCL